MSKLNLVAGFCSGVVAACEGRALAKHAQSALEPALRAPGLREAGAQRVLVAPVLGSLPVLHHELGRAGYHGGCHLFTPCWNVIILAGLGTSKSRRACAVGNYLQWSVLMESWN